MLRQMMLVAIIRFFFLKMTRVGQQNSGEIHGSGRRVNRSFVTVRNEPRQVTGVIDVGVRQNDGVHRRRVHRRIFPVSQPQFFEALKQTAVEKNSAI